MLTLESHSLKPIFGVSLKKEEYQSQVQSYSGCLEKDILNALATTHLHYA